MTSNKSFVTFTLIAGFLMGNSAISHANQATNFELELKHLEPRLKDSSELNIDSIGLRFGQIDKSSPLRLDLFLGRLLAERRNHTPVMPPQPDGYYIGVEARAESSATKRFRAGGSVSLSYNSATNSIVGPGQLELTWRQAEARVWLSMQLGERLKAYGCAATLNIDGDQRHTSSGTTTITDLKIDEHVGYCGGLELAMPEEGYIGFEAGGQSLRGGRLYFGKRF